MEDVNSQCIADSRSSVWVTNIGDRLGGVRDSGKTYNHQVIFRYVVGGVESRVHFTYFEGEGIF